MNLIKDKHNGEPKIWWHNGGADEAIDARIEDGDGLIFTEENELKIAMFDAATSSWIGNGAATEIEKPDDPLVVGEYFVKFYVNKELYETVKTLGGHTINEPEDPEAPEGYTFKNWLLNGEAFDFSTVITSDILLIAEFEEAPAPTRSWTWDGITTSEKDIIYESVHSHWVDEAPAYSASDYIGATLVVDIDGVESSYTLEAGNIQELSEEGMDAILIDIEDTQMAEVSIYKDVEGVATGIYFVKYVDSAGEVPTHFTKSLTLAE